MHRDLKIPLAEIGYLAFCREQSAKTGMDISSYPDFKHIPKTIQSAWEAAAEQIAKTTHEALHAVSDRLIKEETDD